MASIEITQIAAQVIGVAACGVEFAGIKSRNDKKAMLMLSGAQLLFTASFIMLGLVSGAMLSFLAAVKFLWAQFSQKGRSKKFSSYVWVEIFSAICISSVIVSYTFGQNGWIEIFPLGGVLLSLLAVTCCRTKTLTRSIMIASSAFWLVYCALGFAIGAVISQIIAIASHVKAILRNNY